MGAVGAGLEGVGEGVAEEFAPAVEGEGFAGVENGAVSGLGPDAVEFLNVSDGTFELKSFGVRVVFDDEGRHPNLPESGGVV